MYSAEFVEDCSIASAGLPKRCRHRTCEMKVRSGRMRVGRGGRVVRVWVEEEDEGGGRGEEEGEEAEADGVAELVQATLGEGGLAWEW